MPIAMMAQMAMQKKQENDAGSQAGAAQAAQGADTSVEAYKAPEGQAAQPQAANQVAAPKLPELGSGGGQGPDANQVTGFLGLSPETWKTVGQAGQILGAARGQGAQMSALPGAPNLGVSFSAPSMPAQYAMMQAPQFAATQAPQFPYIGVPGGRQ
jgi:hypothetical protein